MQTLDTQSVMADVAQCRYAVLFVTQDDADSRAARKILTTVSKFYPQVAWLEADLHTHTAIMSALGISQAPVAYLLEHGAHAATLHCAGRLSHVVVCALIRSTWGLDPIS